MTSTAKVDYSIRQNKTIERDIVFDGLRRIYDCVPSLPSPVYIGFGSVWFTDFHLAHRRLGVSEMISMEIDEVTAVRAEFNKPYKTIEVLEGDSVDLLPELLSREALRDRPWIVWLDFDQALDSDRLQQIDDLVRYLPTNSTILSTFSASPGRYGKPLHRPQFLEGLLGFSVGQLTADDVRDESDLAQVLAHSLENRMVSLALTAGRSGVVKAFRLHYRDGTPMVTVGAFLGDDVTGASVLERTTRDDWPGIVSHPITTPPLTSREVSAIRRMLPADGMVSREDVRAAGFDLEDDQLAAFTTHYNRYPTFVQVGY